MTEPHDWYVDRPHGKDFGEQRRRMVRTLIGVVVLVVVIALVVLYKWGKL